MPQWNYHPQVDLPEQLDPAAQSELSNLPASELDVSVVVPCFNEAESLPVLKDEICQALEAAGLQFEMVFVDDGSTDETRQVLAGFLSQDERVEVIRLGRNAGKAAALAAGFVHARAPVLCTLDADLQDDPSELPALVARVRGGDADLIVGWKKDRRDPWTKVVPSRIFNWMLRRVTPLRLHDINCGLKVMASEVAKTTPLYGDLYRFLPAFACSQGYLVEEAEVHHRSRRFGRSKYGAWRFLRGFLDLFTLLVLTRFQFRPLHFFGGAGLLFMTAGLGVLSFLTVRWFQGEAIGHRPALFLGVLLFLTGLQGLGIGLIAEMIGHAREKGAGDAAPARRIFSNRSEPK
ncbi:MAG: glycosyltransferase family 2 protein [Polyangia bacterium]|jgi:glycosyltransferase involved in cell wall biosynthesis|nr:glycosyltransferase family 2 protein [Polyangia bacterium]